MTKTYHRSDAAFKATLLLPPVDNVLRRLMSPQERSKLIGRTRPRVDLLRELLDEQFEEANDVTLDAINTVVANYEAAIADEVGPYASYPDDFNFLAHSIGSSPARYEPWFQDLGGLHVTPGVTTIFAGTGVGKTTMADLLTFNLLDSFKGDTTKLLRIKLGESGSDLETFLRFSELAEALPDQLPPVIIIDSVRLQTFDMGGSSRSLSISNRLFRWLTEIDIFAVGHGVAVILVMNPLAGEEDKIEQFRGDVESSVMSVINLSKYNEGTFKHRGAVNGRVEASFHLPGEISRVAQPVATAAVAQEVAISTELAVSNQEVANRTTYGRTRATKP